MGRSDRIGELALAFVVAGLCAFVPPAHAADLGSKTVQQFDHYIQLAERRMEPAGHEPFLWFERLPPDRRADAQSQLRAGQVVIECLDANRVDGENDDPAKPIWVPGGMIHDWVGTVFIPGATLAETIAFEQDYDDHQDFFRPNVVRSKILRREGDDFIIQLRLLEKKVITTVIDTQQEVHYQAVDRTRAFSRSRATRIQEVDHAGEADETLEPVGHDRGFLWRMNTYWRFEESDGGTYVECRSISLTRDIPTGLGWLIEPYLTSVPRESLTFTLATTRSQVSKRIAARHSSIAP